MWYRVWLQHPTPLNPIVFHFHVFSEYVITCLKTPLCQAKSLRDDNAGLVNLLWAAPLYWKRSSDSRKVLRQKLTGGETGAKHNAWRIIEKISDTLSSNQDERDVLNISILGHLGVIVVDGVERGFIFEAEHKYHRVHPGGKLNENEVKIYQKELIEPTCSSGGPPSSLISSR